MYPLSLSIQHYVLKKKKLKKPNNSLSLIHVAQIVLDLWLSLSMVKLPQAISFKKKKAKKALPTSSMAHMSSARGVTSFLCTSPLRTGSLAWRPTVQAVSCLNCWKQMQPLCVSGNTVSLSRSTAPGSHNLSAATTMPLPQ